MSELERACNEAATGGSDLVILMQAIRVLLQRGQERIHLYSSQGHAGDPQAIQSLANDVTHDYELALGLGRVTHEVTARLKLAIESAGATLRDRMHGVHEDLSHVWRECERTIEHLDAVGFSIKFMELHAAAGIETLRNAAQFQDLEQEAAVAFDDLLRRLRGI
jgi:hypothetical protein